MPTIDRFYTYHDLQCNRPTCNLAENTAGLHYNSDIPLYKGGLKVASIRVTNERYSLIKYFLT